LTSNQVESLLNMGTTPEYKVVTIRHTETPVQENHTTQWNIFMKVSQTS